MISYLRHLMILPQPSSGRPRIKKMDDLEAIEIIEGSSQPESEKHVIDAWQQLINTGICWDLQGWYGRRARELIESKICHEVSQR
jgi:hypothetical protein